MGDVRSGPCWVIDPIDGTTSFLHGYPCYSVSIALLHDGTPMAGAVYNAALGEMHSAEAGAGAFRDGERLRVSSAVAVSDALLVTGFPYDRTAPLDRQLSVLAEFLRNPVHGIRRDGSAAIDCCHVAGARCDGFWEYALKVWDVAAGVLICREAGAHVTDVDGAPWTVESDSICAANPGLHAAMLEVIGRATADGTT
jgi:myo-inositol-1(or 4)-monophosphatase